MGESSHGSVESSRDTRASSIGKSLRSPNNDSGGDAGRSRRGSSALCDRTRGRIAKAPNVVLILADDLGYGDPRCYNAKSKVPTPRMDRLATEGMRFSDAHTPASVCTPTRVRTADGPLSVAVAAEVGGAERLFARPGRAGPRDLATLLHDAGYRTGCVGKWHLGFGTEERVDYGKPLVPGPNAVGFDEAFVLPASLDMPPYVFVEDDHPTLAPSETIAASGMRRHGGRGFWREGAIAPGFRHIDTLPTLADRAVQFIERQDASTPFFLYVPFTGPHTPWMPLDAFRGKSGRRILWRLRGPGRRHFGPAARRAGRAEAGR